LPAPGHPPDRRDQAGRPGDRQPDPGEGGQEQGCPALPRGGIRHPLRPGDQSGRRHPRPRRGRKPHREVRLLVLFRRGPDRSGPGGRTAVPGGESGDLQPAGGPPAGEARHPAQSRPARRRPRRGGEGRPEGRGKMSRSMDQTRIKKWVDRIVEEINVNAARVSQEIRETGELAVLLGKAARGQGLSREERRTAREQRVDPAKSGPSLAILAAPGGTRILAALPKVLPFNLLPRAFQSRPGASNAEPEGGAAAASAGEVSGAPDAGESVA